MIRLRFLPVYALILVMTFSIQTLSAQKKKSEAESPESKGFFQDSTFSDIKFRSIGPAFMSGRIADIAIHPEDESTWYIAVGSGGVWKTENHGTTWKPIFDSQSVYSTGCVTIDPSNPHTVWVGTGENVGGRHVSFGDGIYRSTDGGSSWKNMGLAKSEHISKIIIHPDNSDKIWVAAQGPLWSKGGERGLYVSSDGGESWERTLGDDQWTGVTDLVIDPRDPMVLYAATWDRHRTVAAYMGGGPGSGLHRSTDGGMTWEKLTSGLPSSNLGKIGLAISPQDPDVLYAAIELDNRSGAVYRSADRGSSWTEMSKTVSGATGPHYYQELYASPHQFDKLYLMDVRVQVSDDGGKTFVRMNEKHKHSDNHAMAFKLSDPDYRLVGSDGGLYESFDGEKTWRFMANLPLTQFYKVAVDDSEPFYFIYGGTQDNNTQGGPSRTDNYHGIRNADWFITLWGDGHQPATEPGNPDIMYSEWQQGNLCRIDRTTGEFVYIKPQAEEGAPHERFNWDAPILVSPHNPQRLYFASQRVWRSDNRGDTWEAISEDLTRNEERFALEIMGSSQGIDNPWDVYAMSDYNTITSLAESPLRSGLIYAGTDDGIIQITEDGGSTWRKVLVNALPGVPATAFVNDIKADLHDENTVYVILDDHKSGDYSPFVYKSSDKGATWKNMGKGLPTPLLAWRIVQDHEDENLFFLATEFGIYTSLDAGQRWVKFTGGLPTISFRDLAIQRRENDLVGASFGRGFYVLDDYAFLREVSEEELAKESVIFPIKDALWYIKRPVLSFSEKGSQGDAYFTAPNPPFGATFTYHLNEGLKSKKEMRKEAEKERKNKDQDITFPGWDSLDDEYMQEAPALWAIIKDGEGRVIRKLKAPHSKGFHRLTWDLRRPSTRRVSLEDKPVGAPEDEPTGLMVGPGDYTVSLVKQVDGEFTEIAPDRSFKVVKMKEGALEGASPQEVAAFWKELEDFQRDRSAITFELERAQKRVKALQTALARAGSRPGDLDSRLHATLMELKELDRQLNGSPSKRAVRENTAPTLSNRYGFARTGVGNSTYGPTPAHRESLTMAQEELGEIRSSTQELLDETLPGLEKEVRDTGAPWVEGMSAPLGR
ncbi:MAG: glycosyl hydrolase [Flavobacteriales bacterium]|nr:glycosyl hydrolase [Flavobacteriales bacterium]